MEARGHRGDEATLHRETSCPIAGHWRDLTIGSRHDLSLHPDLCESKEPSRALALSRGCCPIVSRYVIHPTPK
jgi:hypothetical protein